MKNFSDDFFAQVEQTFKLIHLCLGCCYLHLFTVNKFKVKFTLAVFVPVLGTGFT
jgi:hypothetical protein